MEILNNKGENKMLLRVELVLENCEEVHVLAEDIGWISAKGITEQWIYSNNGQLDKYKIAKYFMMKINNNANKIENYPTMTFEEQTELPFNRLMAYKDITQVHFRYHDSKKDEFFFVNWHDDDEYSNRYQEVIQRDSSLDIHIESDKAEN